MIPAAHINELIQKMASARPQPGVSCKIRMTSSGYAIDAVSSENQISHPWQTKVAWDTELKKWVATILPGFVNGIDPTASVLNAQTKKMVATPLTNQPRIPISALVDRTADSGYTIPRFFSQLGASLDKSVQINSQTQIVQGENGAGWRRLLSSDLYLSIARIAVNGTIQINDATGTSGSVVSYVPEFDLTALRKYGNRPRLMQVGNLKEKQALTAQQRIVGSITGQAQSDFPEDQLLVATIFFLSPPGTDSGAALDETWTAYVSHNLFYNLCHASQSIANVKSPPGPITIFTGLAGGLGDAIANQDLATINDAASALSSGLINVSQEGRFWTI